MVPRSLRWDIHPQQCDTDLESWFKYFNEAGTKFQNFLITRKRNRLSVLDREIKEMKDSTLLYKNSIEYNSLLSNLQAHLIKEDRDQRIKKHKKYSRDIGDYKSGAVFGWQKPSGSVPPPEVVANPSGHTNRRIVADQQANGYTRPSSASGVKGQQFGDNPSH